MPKTHHLMIGTDSWCQWTGCQAGQDIMTKAGRQTCDHRSGAAAKIAAQALRPHFRKGAVKIVAGPCPHS